MKIDAWAIALDETDHYNISKADAPLIESIRGVYLFDRNQVTHVCELTSSFFLIHLYNQIILVDDIDESRREELYNNYECHANDDIYMHCNTINRIVDKNDSNTSDHYGELEVSCNEDDYDDQLESVREYFCGNCPF